MVKATIKSQTGATITIEGTKEEVSDVISQFERSTAVGNVKKVLTKNAVIKKEQKKRSTASDLIVEIKEEGFFEKPKTLSEIATKLEEKGYIYPTTTLSGVIIKLLKKRLLGRKKVDGKWVYGK
jgi:hypothetical protein